MPLFKKALLKVGTHESPDGQLVVTPKRLKHWAKTFGDMKGANLGIPVSFDHSDDLAQAIPIAFSTERDKNRSAKNSVGWLNAFELSEDGQSAELTLDIRDKKAIEKADTNVVELSPVFFREWTDGTGKTWKDCITHADLVLHPVESQEGFTRVDPPVIACSLRGGVDTGKPVTYRMAVDDKAGDEEIEAEVEENPDLPETARVDDAARQLQAIVARLALLGVALPSDTTTENFYDRLLTGLMTHEATQQALEAEADNGDEDEDMSDLQESSPAFAAMSLRANAAHSFAEKQYRMGLTQRLDKLRDSGRCSPAEHTAQSEAMGAIKLSLDSESGEPTKSELERFLESREVLPAGAAWDPEQRLRMSKVTESKIDRDFTGDEPDENEVDELVDTFFKKPKKEPAGA